MATVTAQLSNYRQSPRKVRLVANLVRGKKVVAAFEQLTFLPKRASEPVKKLIESAVANAKSLSIGKDDLYVREIRVDKGVTLHRSMPRARGRAFEIKKRSSHIVVVLDTESFAAARKAARVAKSSKATASAPAAQIIKEKTEAKPKARAKKATK
jgi:large subunit ribosomal protein L22